MANVVAAAESQLQRIIRDLNVPAVGERHVYIHISLDGHASGFGWLPCGFDSYNRQAWWSIAHSEAVAELTREYKESGDPITDDSSNLHRFSYKLEYLLQFDQKEKTTFLGTRKDYWEYFSDCLSKIKGANDGIRFVKSIPELKTSLGKGRAFIRYSLVHQRLADTLQQCLMNQRVTSDWYYARSPFLKPHLSVDIINHLYELNEIQFDVASRGYDLDAAWPTFARRTLGLASSPSHLWKPPSRSSSISSLVSSCSQQVQDFPSSPDLGHTLLRELSELSEPAGDSSAAEDLRIELDQSELRQRDLLGRVGQLGDEAAELRGVVEQLQAQLEVALASQAAAQELEKSLRALERDASESQRALEEARRELDALRAAGGARETSDRDLRARLAAAEGKNVELLSKLDSALSVKGQQVASHFDSAQKIHDLLDQLNETEKGRLEALQASEERKMEAERLTEELRLKEAAAGEASSKALERTRELCSALDNLKVALAAKEKESSDQQRQLQDLQRSLDAREGKVEELKRKAQEEKGHLQQRYGDLRDSLEGQLHTLTEQLRAKEEELSTNVAKIQVLEEQVEKLGGEMETLTCSSADLEANVKDQAKKIEDYKTQCNSLMEINGKLMQTVKRNEETKKELKETKVALEIELATLRASEKQLRSQVDDVAVAVGDREKRLREENRRLEESYQMALMQKETSEGVVKKLEQEKTDLMEEQAAVKATLSTLQEELRVVSVQNAELGRSIAASRKSEASLEEKLQEMAGLLENKERLRLELQGRMRELEGMVGGLERVKADAEIALVDQTAQMESIVTEKKALEATQAQEAQEAAARLLLVEGQLDLNAKEVSRLQAEVLDLRAELQCAEDERRRSQARLEVAEASCGDLQALSEQLKGQTEELNRQHVEEMLRCKEREEALAAERDREAQARSDLVAEAASVKEELSLLKDRHERLALENAETREGLHRANTEMAELGVAVCRLTSENEEARNELADASNRLQRVKEEAAQETESLKAGLAALRQENTSLREEVKQSQDLPQTILDLKDKLERTEGQARNLQEATREEVEAMKFQMSSEAMSHQNQLTSVSDQLEGLRGQLNAEQVKVSDLEAKVSQLEAANGEFSQLIEEKNVHVAKCEAMIRQSEEELRQLKENLTRREEELSAAQKERTELSERLEMATAEKRSNDLKASAEIDDLFRTKTNLEERLIELIKDKDALWQKSDALEFEQKLRAEEQWWLVDKETPHCLGCQSQFTWWLRRHHCRLCGRIFCYYCSNNFVMTKHSGRKERCCRECYAQHSAVVERLTQAELGIAPGTPTGPDSSLGPAPYTPTPRVTVTEPGARSEDAPFDIITEEELNGIYDGDSVTQMAAETRQLGALDTSTGMGNTTPEEGLTPVLQDAEIGLLISGELTLVVPLTMEDVGRFGDASRELFIKSSCYSTVPITVPEAGSAIGWLFSSEPKSIAFSVVYRESADAPLEQAKVLIPLTRCNSHQEAIQGQLKVRNPGVYILIFDNSFSRFISKKVLYHLTIEKPIIYDGSDFS